jgi:hypothetical protein
MSGYKTVTVVSFGAEKPIGTDAQGYATMQNLYNMWVMEM